MATRGCAGMGAGAAAAMGTILDDRSHESPVSGSFTTSSINFCSSFSLFAINIVLSVYLKILTFIPPTALPGMSYMDLKMISLYTLNKSGDNTHLCFTAHLIGTV